MKKIRFAVDIGTTNIELCLVDVNGLVLGNKTFPNRQSLYGSDVLNRIYTVTRDASFLKVMKNMVIEDLKQYFLLLLEENGYNPSNVDIIIISGNTTMISILLSYDITSMGYAPFSSVLGKSVYADAGIMFDGMFCDNVKVLLTGCVSAFVGGDILSGMYFLKKTHSFGDDTISLFIDMGTNGEIVLCNRGIYIATSTACGPAFEGCTRKQHIYGATVIDALSMGINSGKIDRKGILDDDYIASGIDIMDVHIDSNIIEQILVAKSAICTGVMSLLDMQRLTFSDIEKVYIAGGFGFYLNQESAMNIGLLPQAFSGKMEILGNTSLQGAVSLLDDLKETLDIDTYSISVINLANDDRFKENLIENMSFARI